MNQDETAAGEIDASTAADELGASLQYIDGVAGVQDHQGRLIVYVTNNQVARQVMSKCGGNHTGWPITIRTGDGNGLLKVEAWVKPKPRQPVRATTPP